MKKTTKLAGIFTGLLALVGVTFTSCDVLQTFGKDYFYGTWQTLDYNNDGSEIKCYQGDNSNYYRIVWSFNGKSENIDDGGYFRQHLYNYGTSAPTNLSTASVTNETYWFGKYDIKGNSSYSRGKYFMNYQVGIDLDDQIAAGLYVDGGQLKKDSAHIIAKGSSGYRARANEIVALLDSWEYKDSLEKFLNYAYSNNNGLNNLKTDADLIAKPNTTGDEGYSKNGIYINVRYSNSGAGNTLLCNNVSYFRFNLKDSSPTGYTRMLTTIYGPNGTDAIGKVYNQWKNENTALSDANLVSSGTSVWTGTGTRCLGKIKNGSPLDAPEYLASNKTANTTYFNFNTSGNSVDSEDTNNYTNVDASVEK